jgi:hypothetical protein
VKLGKDVICHRYTDTGVVFNGIHSLAKILKDFSDSAIDTLRAFHPGEERDLLQRQVLIEP